MTIATAALATASLTVMTFWSGVLNAGNDGEQAATQITKPKLVAHGIEMTLTTTDGRTFNAGEEPTFELTAVNTTDETATAAVRIAMTASSPADTWSRVLRLPTSLWQHNPTLVLQPNETKVLTLAVPAKLPPNSTVAVSLEETTPAPAPATAAGPVLLLPGAPQSGIVALNFATTVPVAQTASAN
ncbi:MAG: hypothetical protein NTW21_03765 [Verrucomicrobia bacterium]|nr:hypothetical protein [Verrucomicrobiota bacterium]